LAVHCDGDPPLLPAQLQDQGPVPLTAEAVPLSHKPAVGALSKKLPPLVPQIPRIGMVVRAGLVVPPEGDDAF
jgi:hypothetical protein